jgi:hypothetical protein
VTTTGRDALGRGRGGVLGGRIVHDDLAFLCCRGWVGVVLRGL